jgi:hypothetical protein
MHLASKIATAANFRNMEGNFCTPAQKEGFGQREDLTVYS